MSVADRTFDELWVCHLGTVPYRDALAMQQDDRRPPPAPDRYPTRCCCSSTRPSTRAGGAPAPGELPLGEDFYRARGIEVVPTDRGGRVTYHGPGQLVGYPIMGVADVVAHLRTIEEAIVAALAEEGIAARSRPQDGPDYTGVWVRERKIASLGVHVSRRRLDARVCGQRGQRPGALHLGGRLRAARRGDDLDRRRAGR